MLKAIGEPFTEEVFVALKQSERVLYGVFFIEAEKLIAIAIEIGKDRSGLIPSDLLKATYREIILAGGERFCPVRQIAQVFDLEETAVQTIH